MHRKFTKYLLGIFLLITLMHCDEQPDTDFYLVHRKLGTPFNRRHHYRLFKDEGDSIRVWILNHDYNAGYFSWKLPFAVPKKVGKFGIIELTDIQENSITCKITEGGTEHDLGRLYPADEQDAHEVLNILRMLQINHQMENFIQEAARCARPNTNYISIDYSADEKCSELNPVDFDIYYSDKMKKEALKAIAKIDSVGCEKEQM